MEPVIVKLVTTYRDAVRTAVGIETLGPINSLSMDMGKVHKLS